MSSDATFVRSDDADGQPATLTVTFDPPLPFPNAPIGGFTLKEPTARQLRESEKERNPAAPWAGEIAYMMRLIVLNATDPTLKPKAGDYLGMMVINQCMTFLNEFIEAGPDDDEVLGEDETPQATMLPIDPPISFAGVTYTELDLREPLGVEIRNARLLMREPGNLFESRRSQMHLVTQVSGLPAPVIEQLRITTLNKAGRILGRFTTAGRPSGRS